MLYLKPRKSMPDNRRQIPEVQKQNITASLGAAAGNDEIFWALVRLARDDIEVVTEISVFMKPRADAGDQQAILWMERNLPALEFSDAIAYADAPIPEPDSFEDDDPPVEAYVRRAAYLVRMADKFELHPKAALVYQRAIRFLEKALILPAAGSTDEAAALLGWLLVEHVGSPDMARRVLDLFIQASNAPKSAGYFYLDRSEFPIRKNKWAADEGALSDMSDCMDFADWLKIVLHYAESGITLPLRSFDELDLEGLYTERQWYDEVRRIAAFGVTLPVFFTQELLDLLWHEVCGRASGTALPCPVTVVSDAPAEAVMKVWAPNKDGFELFAREAGRRWRKPRSPKRVPAAQRKR